MHALSCHSRDNARTPICWDDSENAGFTDGTPWIRVNPNYKDINVKKALADKNSLFYHYQKLIKLRKTYKVIQEGKFVPLLKDDDAIFAYKRETDDEELIVINNFYGKEAKAHIDLNGDYTILLSNYKDTEITEDLDLRPYESYILYRQR